MAKTVINNGDLGSVARAGINNNFTELYNYDVSSNIIISRIDTSLNNTISLDEALTPDISTATNVIFNRVQGYIYGTKNNPITGNITATVATGIIGATNLIISASTGTPTFPSTFKLLSGTYRTATTTNLNVDTSRNLVYVQYIDASTQPYTISQIKY